MKFPSKMAEVATNIYDRISESVSTFDRGDGEHSHSRSSGRQERGGTGWQLTDKEMLEHDIQDAKRELAELGSKIERQEHQIRSIEGSLPEMISRNADVKNSIDTVNQDLTATRAHAPDEGTMLKGEIINEFVEVTRCIDDIINTFLEWCGRWVDRPLSRPRGREIRECFRGKEGMQDADKLVDLATGRDLRLITEILLRRHLSLALEQVVFRPFLPGEMHGDPTSDVLSKVLATVQVKELQDRSGRWRALTYKQAAAAKPRDEKWCAEPTALLVKAMLDLLTVIADIKFTERAVETAFQLTSRMFNAAAEFKDRATIICTEVDFMVYLPSSKNRFDLRFMKEAYTSRSSSKSIILGFGLGLMLNHNIEQDSTFIRRYAYPNLALVIGDKSGFFA